MANEKGQIDKESSSDGPAVFSEDDQNGKPRTETTERINRSAFHDLKGKIKSNRNTGLVITLGAAVLAYFAYDGDMYDIRTKTNRTVDEIEHRIDTINSASSFAIDNTASNLYELIDVALSRPLKGTKEEVSPQIEKVVGILDGYRDEKRSFGEAEAKVRAYVKSLSTEEKVQLLGNLDEKSKASLRDYLEAGVPKRQVVNRSVGQLLEADEETRKAALTLLYDRLDGKNKEKFARNLAREYDIETMSVREERLFRRFKTVVASYCSSDLLNATEGLVRMGPDIKEYCNQEK